MSGKAQKEVLLIGFGAIGAIYSLILKRSGLARISVVARSNFDVVKGSTDQSRVCTFKVPSTVILDPGSPTIVRLRNLFEFSFPACPHTLWLLRAKVLPIGTTTSSAANLTSYGFTVYRSVEDAVREGRNYSYVVIATKALPDLTPTSTLISPFLLPTSRYYNRQPSYVILQNGLGLERDLYVDMHRKGMRNLENINIIGTAVYIGTNLLAPNVVEHNHFDRCSLGVYRHDTIEEIPHTANQAAALNGFASLLMQGGSEATVVPEIQRIKFIKNFWNAAWGSVATLTDTRLPSFFSPKEIEEEMIPSIRALMYEILDIGRAMGFDEEALPSSSVENLIRSVTELHKDKHTENRHVPSMLLDLRSGKPLEVEVVLGELVRQSKERKVEAPRLQLIYAMLRVIQHRLIHGELGLKSKY